MKNQFFFGRICLEYFCAIRQALPEPEGRLFHVFDSNIDGKPILIWGTYNLNVEDASVQIILNPDFDLVQHVKHGGHITKTDNAAISGRCDEAYSFFLRDYHQDGKSSSRGFDFVNKYACRKVRLPQFKSADI